MDHPLVSHKLTLLRSQDTTSPVFRQLVEELVTLLAYEATREVDVVPCTVTTPVTQAQGVELASPKPLVVPILRAGLGMLEGMLRLIPSAEVGFVGMARDEETLQPMTYAERLPSDLSGRQCFGSASRSTPCSPLEVRWAGPCSSSPSVGPSTSYACASWPPRRALSGSAA